MHSRFRNSTLALPVLCLITLAAPIAQAAEPAKIRVMLVATYHFSNPGQDLNNVEAVDVLADARQEQIAEVVGKLARFEPTRVAVEWPANLVDERYTQYRAGTLPVSRNEVVQLGFRLAKLLDLPDVNGIDVDGNFPFEPVMAWARAHGREWQIEEALAAARVEVGKISALQKQTTIAGVLRYINSPESIGRNHAFYPPMLTMGAGEDQPGVALLAAWQARNLAICARLLQAARPGDRVVTFYGQGHIHLLQQCLEDQPAVELIDALDYL